MHSQDTIVAINPDIRIFRPGNYRGLVVVIDTSVYVAHWENVFNEQALIWVRSNFFARFFIFWTIISWRPEDGSS